MEEENCFSALLETHTKQFCARMCGEFSPTHRTLPGVTLSTWS